MITFIRHTSVNFPQGICYGATDVPVAESFFDEAQAIKNSIRESTFHEVWVSPLSRCTKLADSLFGLEGYKVDNRLKELNFGEWEKVPWKNIYNMEYGKHWMDNYAAARCPNGESFMDQISRVKSFYADKVNGNNKNIAIITHAGVIRAFLCYLKQISPYEAFEHKIGYGEVMEVA